MKVSYSEGLATHTGSESCRFGGNGEREALTGVRTGQPLSREIEPHRASDGHSLVPMLLNVAEGKTGSVDIARRFWTTRGLRP
jgi:hypothetical protein